MISSQVARPLPAPDALPLPPAGWGAADALLALDVARPHLDLDGLVAPLVVSALTTVVLRCGDHAVKVYPPGTDAAHLERVRDALDGCTVAVLTTRRPVETAYGVVTLMPWVLGTEPRGWREVGSLLRRFHDETAGLHLPDWTPLSRLPGVVGGLAPEDAAVLLGARADLLAALSSVDSVVGVGAVHGDVSPGNVVVTADGPRLIDLDWVAAAPREHDLASAARRRASGELGRTEYAAFCRAYGADVRGWEGLPVLDRIAELGAVAFRLWECERRGWPLDWVEAELRRWRTPL
ncbi:MAG: hypothetical protein JWN84_2247 [Nocardioides sp.]|nr:hypothetical protein [Nocardioides sp.]